MVQKKMMKPKTEPDLTILIQQARQALAQGEKVQARKLALLATADPVQEEQGWLILASLSEPQQALSYIENALKANPDSQAARKAIRLIYRQMDAEGKTPAELPAVPPIKLLEDTAPIPVLDKAPMVKLPQAELPTPEKTESENKVNKPGKAIEKAAEESLIPRESREVTDSPATAKKANLRHKLRQRAGQKEEITAGEAVSPTEEPSPKISQKNKIEKSHKIVREPDAEAVELPAAAVQQENLAESIALQPKEPQPALETKSPPESPADTQTAVAPEDSASSQAVEAKPVTSASLPAEAVPAKSAEVLPAAHEAPAPDQTQNQPAEKAVAEIMSGKTNRKIAVNKPEQSPHPETTSEAEQTGLQNSKQDPANVDTIELILVSVAAILLPLLVFLYFYLTK
jgi:hypothetical protein